MNNYFILFILIFTLLIGKNINRNYKISKKEMINILWNKKDIIPLSIYEKERETNYVYKDISFKLYIRYNDYLSDIIKIKHYWPDCISLYETWNKFNLWKYSYLIDVGANIGSCALFMLYKHIKVISFEPLKNNLHFLSKSILLNSKFLDNFTLYMAGLSNETAKKSIYIYPGNWGASLCKLDDVKLNIKEKIGMMKIDIECNEINMIKGGINFIKQHFIKIIFFEQLCFCYETILSNKIHIYKLLESLNYKILNKLDCKKEEYADIIAIKKD